LPIEAVKSGGAPAAIIVTAESNCVGRKNRYLRYGQKNLLRIHLTSFFRRMLKKPRSTFRCLGVAMRRLPRIRYTHMKRLLSHRAGFSLMELLAVVVILGIIAALIVPRVSDGTDTAKHKCCLYNHTEIDITVERYYLHTGTWPANDLSDIAADVNYFPEGLPACPLTGAPYSLDPITHRVVGHSGLSDHGP
jgi:general secretion pathway protein G